ncbi:hypothetical protein [Immundisolibacter sp.]
MAKKKLPPYQDTLGKRDIVKNMIASRLTLSEISKAIGCTRKDLDDHYSDLLEKYHPVEHIPAEEDRLLVQRCYALGIGKDDIAHRIGVSTTTLDKYYAHELRIAKAELLDKVGTSLVTQAVNGNVAAAQFIMSRRGGWKETQVNELTGADGAPLAATINITVGGQPLKQ